MANVDLKSLFTSEKQYTVLQLLNAMIDEADKGLVKDATLTQNVSEGKLTLTIKFNDDSSISATTALNSLTDDEKTFLSKVISNVTATSDGLTFLKVVGFEGNETHKGNEIHQGYASFLGDEAHAGTETHKGIVKVNEIDNLDGNAMVRNKDTEGVIAFGTSTKKALIMGSGDRPSYSKIGSDFEGTLLALDNDIPEPKYMHDVMLHMYGTDTTSQAYTIICFSFISDVEDAIEYHPSGKLLLQVVLDALYNTYGFTKPATITCVVNNNSSWDSDLTHAVRIVVDDPATLDILYMDDHVYTIENFYIDGDQAYIVGVYDTVQQIV